MQMTITQGKNGSIVVKTQLRLLDGDTGEELVLRGESYQPSPMAFLSDATQTRSAAAMIVGQMTTRWKMGLIDEIESAILPAVQQYLVSLHGDAAQRGREDGTVADVPAIHIADGADPTP
jgi:hypothetical protein